MRTLESVFEKEFKQSITDVGYKDIYKIPLPKECSTWNISGTELFLVKGIGDSEDPYNKLNGKVVKQLPSGTIARRRAIDKSTRGFQKNPDGSFVYEEYTIPAGSIVVISNENIGVLYKGYRTATKSGYGYIDFVDTGKGREFMYVLPKSVLYGINQTALALSVKNMKNYSGSGYMTWNSGVIFLHVIPYNPRSKYIGSKILCTKCTLNYGNEVSRILNFWQTTGVIPDLRLCVMSDGTNLARRPTAVGYQEYIQVQPLALSDKEVYGYNEVDENAENGDIG